MVHLALQHDLLYCRRIWGRCLRPAVLSHPHAHHSVKIDEGLQGTILPWKGRGFRRCFKTSGRGTMDPDASLPFDILTYTSQSQLLCQITTSLCTSY